MYEEVFFKNQKKKNLVRKRMEVYSVSEDSILFKSLSSGVGWATIGGIKL